jgi:hypothetical protein
MTVVFNSHCRISVDTFRMLTRKLRPWQTPTQHAENDIHNIIILLFLYITINFFYSPYLVFTCHCQCEAARQAAVMTVSGQSQSDIITFSQSGYWIGRRMRVWLHSYMWGHAQCKYLTSHDVLNVHVATAVLTNCNDAYYIILNGY